MLQGDALSAWGALTTFPCRFGTKISFLRPVGARAPSAPSATPMVRDECRTEQMADCSTPWTHKTQNKLRWPIYVRGAFKKFVDRHS